MRIENNGTADLTFHYANGDKLVIAPGGVAVIGANPILSVMREQQLARSGSMSPGPASQDVQSDGYF